MRVFKDEEGRLITENTLRREFTFLRAAERAEHDYSFENYVRNCTGKNGTLTEVRRKSK